MKKVSAILSHLTNQPQFRSLKQHACYKKYISLLGAKWQKAIAFVYIQNDTLFVAVTHPGFKMELNYNKDILKGVLTQLASHDKSCEMLQQAGKIVIFHSKYRSAMTEETDNATVPYYNELASADFIIESQDEELKEKFETIKKRIKTQREAEQS
ncbi:hypothetical protein YH65_02565 [Sulfurovum lithotrophicum]|uniref:DUF721 domain-containing protein n=1 Tax=Sulfurovum lithotrophicum TaxID=206403 RepID=A0A7U4RQ57_9BACT|nr:DciA family protein [Sulfurovum lithotrophicum]AKF24401.1 hypothetical protein YH65_02565 [Sulfurovum lithotrophicum]